MKHIWIAAGALALVSAGAPAMTVAEFLARANAVMAKGARAAESPDFAPLTTEIRVAVEAYRDDLNAARRAGSAPHSCPSAARGVRFSTRELVAEFSAIPSADRGMSVRTAFYAMMKKRYPCDPSASLPPSTAPEQPMTVGQFLAHWEEAQKAGPMARMSPDTRAATRAIGRVAGRYRQMIDADNAAGRPPRSCPPPRGTARITSDDVVPKLKALPVSDHAKPFEEALIPVLDSLYPCPAS